MTSTVAVVLCAGAGTRTNHAINKVYLDIGGVTMAARSCLSFAHDPAIDEVVAVAAERELDMCAQTFTEAGIDLSAVVVGGRTRHASESNALEHLADRITSGEVEVVLIHDGARPLFDGTDLDELVARARRSGGAMYGLPLEDDLIVMSNGAVGGHRPRTGLWRALTPQAFRAAELLDAFRAAERDGFEGTDTASTFERIGGRVEMMRGSSRNLKVTFPEDFVLAECLIEISDEERIEP